MPRAQTRRHAARGGSRRGATSGGRSPTSTGRTSGGRRPTSTGRTGGGRGAGRSSGGRKTRGGTQRPNPYAPPREGSRRSRGTTTRRNRRQRPAKTPGAAWVSLGCFGVFMLLFVTMMALMFNTARTVQDGGAVEGSTIARFGVLAVLCWIAILTGVLSAIIALCKKGAPQGAAITGLILNGLLLLWLVVSAIGNASG